ncbi:MAG: hypothetical protein P1P76_01390 [Anaerolineales bacterium]|nr:hypothetical protein [Anaerolineales bacterium]
MKRLAYASLFVLVLALVSPITTFAAGPEDGRVVLGTDFVLESGEILDGDLAVIGGTATLEVDSVVTGTVAIIGGNLAADGIIEGDLAVVGGNVRFGAAAVLEGDLISFGGNVNRGAAQIGGEFISGDELDIPLAFRFGEFFSDVPVVVSPFMRDSFGWSVLRYFFQSFMLAALAILVVMFLPKQTRLVADTVVEQPLLAGAFGLLTAVVAPILILLLIVTICFAIVGFAAVVFLVAAWVFGMIALGLEVGERLGKATNADLQPVVAAGIGTLIFSLVVNGIGFIPCVGWLAPLLLGAVGLGAVLMTRFGTRHYAPGTTTAVAPVEPEKPAKPK